MHARNNRRRITIALVLFSLPVAMGMAGSNGCPPNMNNPGDGGNSGDRRGIYVTNYSGNSVTVYSLDAEGDVAPIRTIAGAATEIKGPLGIAKNSQGRLFIANREGGAVTVYSLTGDGDIAPVSKLEDAEMGSPEGLVISIADEVFVGNCPTLGGLGGVTGVFHFPNNATSPDYKIAGPNTHITVPVSLALDEARNLFVANAFDGQISLFAPGQSGDQFPVQNFRPGGNTQSIAYGSASVLLGAGSTINLYHSNSSGDTAWVGQIPNVGYTGGIYFDTDVTPPVIYVADFFGNAIHIIQTVGTPPFLSVGSKKSIQGPATGMNAPYGVLVVKN